MKKKLISIYLEYLNDFLTVSRMAEYYGLSVEDMSTLIEMGKVYGHANYELGIGILNRDYLSYASYVSA